MSLMEENFGVAAELDEDAAVRIQSCIRLMETNVETRIRLKNPITGGRAVEFDLVAGSLEELDKCCNMKHIQRSDNRLEA